MFDMPAYISLKLRQVAGSPGTEYGRVAAPHKKVRKDMGEGSFSLKILLCHMDHTAGHVMEPAVQDGTDGLVKSPDLLKGRI